MAWKYTAWKQMARYSKHHVNVALTILHGWFFTLLASRVVLDQEADLHETKLQTEHYLVYGGESRSFFFKITMHEVYNFFHNLMKIHIDA